MGKGIPISIKTLMNAWITIAVLSGALSAFLWMDSNHRWQSHIQKSYLAGIAIHDYLHGHDVLPDVIVTSQLSRNESRLADAGLWQKLSFITGSDKISNFVLDDSVKDQAIYKTIRVTVLSKKIAYKKDDIPLNSPVANAQKLAEITRLLARYCSQNTLLIKYDNALWRKIDGTAIWGCDAQPADWRLAALSIIILIISSLVTLTSLTASGFANFAEKLKHRFRKKDAFLFEVRGTKELQDLAKALNMNIEQERASIQKRAMFLSGVSHDLGTPATRLLLRSEQIEDTELRGKIESDIVRMTDMIQSVLSYTQSEIADEEHRPLSLISLVRTIVDEYADMDKPVSFQEPVISTKAIQNIFQGKSEKQNKVNSLQMENFVVKGDPLALQRAITNLIENALKYGRRAIVSVTGDETYAEVSVLDNGQNLSEEELETLTQPFQRGQNAVNTAGAGIGLAVVHNIAEQHGGTLSFARTEEGMTSTISILRV